MTVRPLPELLAEAWKLRDELDAAAVRAAHAKIETHPEGVRKALEEATAALYFGEKHKWEGKFRAIIRSLDPDLLRILEERGEQAAFDVVRGEDT